MDAPQFRVIDRRGDRRFTREKRCVEKSVEGKGGERNRLNASAPLGCSGARARAPEPVPFLRVRRAGLLPFRIGFCGRPGRFSALRRCEMHGRFEGVAAGIALPQVPCMTCVQPFRIFRHIQRLAALSAGICRPVTGGPAKNIDIASGVRAHVWLLSLGPRRTTFRISRAGPHSPHRLNEHYRHRSANEAARLTYTILVVQKICARAEATRAHLKKWNVSDCRQSPIIPNASTLPDVVPTTSFPPKHHQVRC